MTRVKLPDIRPGITRRFHIEYVDDETNAKRDLKFYVTANVYADGKLAEIFIKGDRIGGLLGGTLDAIAVVFSLGLQYGMPMALVTSKLRHNQFGPGGFITDPDFHSCKSMFDLLAQWLDKQFPNGKLSIDAST